MTVEGQMAGKRDAMHKERGPLMDQRSEGTIETTKRESGLKPKRRVNSRQNEEVGFPGPPESKRHDIDNQATFTEGRRDSGSEGKGADQL